MLYVKCARIVPYSVKQMFCIVNDIDSYTEFIPGCKASKILERSNENELIAELNLSKSGVVKSLITHNVFIKNQYIVIYLVTGPFKSFYGYWEFVPITNTISRVEYAFKYEFSSKFMEKFFEYLLKEVYGDMIRIFVARARQIYDI